MRNASRMDDRFFLLLQNVQEGGREGGRERRRRRRERSREIARKIAFFAA
jgi:hypothetical protein